MHARVGIRDKQKIELTYGRHLLLLHYLKRCPSKVRDGEHPHPHARISNFTKKNFRSGGVLKIYKGLLGRIRRVQTSEGTNIVPV